MFGVATSTVAGALATVAGALAPSAIFSAALFGEGVRVIFPTDPFTGGVLTGGLFGGVLGRLTSGLFDDEATSPGGGSWLNRAGSLGAGGCIGADVAEVCGGTPGLLLAIFGLPPIGGGGGGGGRDFFVVPTVLIVPRYCPPT